MGFRSNFITEALNGIEIPEWFMEKYPDYKFTQNKDGKTTFALADLRESKFYQKLEEDERLLDMQKVLKKNQDIVVILLHECGGITRIHITKSNITAQEPIKWKSVTHVEHDYCYGCSNNH